MPLNKEAQKRRMEKNNHLYILTLFITFVIIGNLYSQETDPELVDLISDTKAKMKAFGYKFIEHVEGETSTEYVLEFNQQKFIYGYSYIVVSFFKKCSDCHLTVEFWNKQTEATEILGVNTIFNDSSYNMSECKINKTYNTFFYTDYSDKRGYIYTFVNDDTPHYLNSLMFYK